MKVLIYIAGVRLGSSTGQHLDMAISEMEKGNEVFVLHCDHSVGLCLSNPLANPLYCKMCSFYQRAETKRLAPKGMEHHWMKDFVEKIDRLSLPKFTYNSAKELKALEYKGIEVGYGVMSSYISLTRNLYPAINEKSRPYFDALIEEQLVTLEVIEMLQKKYHFELMIFQNGRGAQFKPFLNFCQREKVNFWCTEDFGSNKNKNYMNNFWNSTPHELTGKAELFQKCWETSSDSKEKRIEISQSFFKNRRNAIPAGDKVYTGNQINGLMPDGWNDDVENIVIFNSSEDEFAAVNHEVDNQALFPSQIDGLIAILDHYKDDETKHFTLRVHPNLKDIPYKYHRNLYKLTYKNFTIVPGDSPISSYSLMDAANKIIVFGSTMGIESSYWGKPVICLGSAFYRDLNVVYLPKNEKELWNLIDTKELANLFNERGLYYPYFNMSENHEPTKHISIDVFRKSILGYHPFCYEYQKLLGSHLLYSFSLKIGNIFKNKYPARFKCLPTDEA